jgi:Spy/CpxP family protein refolding chaperone
MKRLLLVMAGILAFSVGTVLAQPAEKPVCGPGPKCEKGPGGPVHRPGPGFMLGMFDRVARELPEKLNFTPEQKEKFNVLAQTHRTAMEALVKQLEQEKQKFETDLNGILTPDQQAKLKELKKAREFVQKRFQEGMKGQALKQGMVVRAVKELNLPPEKNEKVMDVLTESRAKFLSAPKGDRQIRKQLMREMMDKIREVLAPEEFQRLQEMLRAQRGEMGRGQGGHRGGPDQGPGFQGNQPGLQGGPGEPSPLPPPASRENPLF